MRIRCAPVKTKDPHAGQMCAPGMQVFHIIFCIGRFANAMRRAAEEASSRLDQSFSTSRSISWPIVALLNHIGAVTPGATD